MYPFQRSSHRKAFYKTSCSAKSCSTILLCCTSTENPWNSYEGIRIFQNFSNDLLFCWRNHESCVPKKNCSKNQDKKLAEYLGTSTWGHWTLLRMVFLELFLRPQAMFNDLLKFKWYPFSNINLNVWSCLRNTGRTFVKSCDEEC